MSNQPTPQEWTRWTLIKEKVRYFGWHQSFDKLHSRCRMLMGKKEAHWCSLLIKATLPTRFNPRDGTSGLRWNRLWESISTGFIVSIVQSLSLAVVVVWWWLLLVSYGVINGNHWARQIKHLNARELQQYSSIRVLLWIVCALSEMLFRYCWFNEVNMAERMFPVFTMLQTSVDFCLKMLKTISNRSADISPAWTSICSTLPQIEGCANSNPVLIAHFGALSPSLYRNLMQHLHSRYLVAWACFLI